MGENKSSFKLAWKARGSQICEFWQPAWLKSWSSKGQWLGSNRAQRALHCAWRWGSKGAHEHTLWKQQYEECLGHTGGIFIHSFWSMSKRGRILGQIHLWKKELALSIFLPCSSAKVQGNLQEQTQCWHSLPNLLITSPAPPPSPACLSPRKTENSHRRSD